MEPLKIGRISRRIEKALGRLYEGDVYVRIAEETLRSLVAKYPTRYLAAIENAKETIKDPDFAGYGEGRIVLARAFLTGGKIRYLAITIKEDGGFWLERMGGLKDEETLRLQRDMGLRRVMA